MLRPIARICEGLTSSDLFGRGASSGFLAIFWCRLSLLDGRVAVLSSASLTTERLAAAVGVVPRAVRELAMLEVGCEPEAACAEFIEDDEFLGRAVTGGVVRLAFGFSMLAMDSQTELAAASTQKVKEQLECWQSRCDAACEAKSGGPAMASQRRFAATTAHSHPSHQRLCGRPFHHPITIADISGSTFLSIHFDQARRVY